MSSILYPYCKSVRVLSCVSITVQSRVTDNVYLIGRFTQSTVELLLFEEATI